ncbi:MAG TPA: cytochrome P450 [Planctomycetaceae bacterium]|jgi:cytochrome P450|nr:cytochrome P450 [Planctomycetaceae bacterium]
MSTINTIPGPRGHWLLGSLRELRRDPLEFYSRMAREFGDVVSYRLGPHPVVLVSRPDLIEQVLVTDNKHFIKHYALRLLRPILGNGLITSDGSFWLRQRRLIQPAFNRQRIESYAGVMVELTDRLLATWRDGETRDLHADMMQLALGIVSKTLLDVDAGDRYSEVASAIEVILNDFDERFRSAFPPPFWLPLVPRNRRLKAAVRHLDAIIETIIGQRRAERGDRGDLLSLLIEARDEEDATGMTDRQLRDEVMTMFLAGHETTANALAWTWSLLATHPAVADRLRDELASALDGRPPTAADVPHLVYTGQILQESMRLYPPAYTFGREATADVELGGYRIRKGTTVLISQWVMHRDPRFFERPDAFDPDRWSAACGKGVPRYAYFPFGGGPRTCVGNSFAMLEATLVLATIASRFQVTLAPGAAIAPRASVTLRPQNGVPCVIHRRDAGGWATTGNAARPVRTGT